MNSKSTFWVAAAALLVAAVGLAFGVVAIVREDGRASGAAMGGMSMGGMSTGGGMSSGGMSDHMAAAPMDGVADATASKGGTVLKHTVQDGVWVFRIAARPVKWEILPGTRLTAWTYNGLVPGPEIRVPYGTRVRVIVSNDLPEPTTVHWHGIAVPNAMDGVPDVTQKAIEPGDSFTYEFEAIPAGRDSKGGTFMYHSHFDEDRQVGLGLTGTLVIEEPTAKAYDVERTMVISEWNLDPGSGATRPAMEMEGLLPNYFTLNGKSFPATETVSLKRGDRVLLRLVGAGQFVHPMHLHGTDFTVVAKDGHPLDSPYNADVLQVAAGERYDISFTATEPGTWVFHCHIGHHLTNNGASPGGLLMAFKVKA